MGFGDFEESTVELPEQSPRVVPPTAPILGSSPIAASGELSAAQRQEYISIVTRLVEETVRLNSQVPLAIRELSNARGLDVRMYVERTHALIVETELLAGDFRRISASINSQFARHGVVPNEIYDLRNRLDQFQQMLNEKVELLRSVVSQY